MMKGNYQYDAILVVFLVLSAFSFGCSDKKNEPINETVRCSGDDCKKQLISALESLSKIEISEGIPETQINSKHKEIEMIVERFNNPEDISGLALLSKTMARHCSISDISCSKESKIISTYESAYWTCVRKLAVKKEENKNVLDELKFLSQLSGTDVGDWERIVDGKNFP